MMFDTTSSAMAQVKSGKLQPLAVTSPQRSSELPNVPTMVEAGYPAAEMTTWYGLFVTGGTPRPIVEKLHAEFDRTLKLPDVQARLAGLGGEPGTLPLEQFADMNREGIRAVRRIDHVEPTSRPNELTSYERKTMSRPRIAFLPGDPNGIGPELAAKLLARPANVQAADIVVFADPATIAAGERVANVKALVGAAGDNRATLKPLALGGAEAITPGIRPRRAVTPR